MPPGHVLNGWRSPCWSDLGRPLEHVCRLFPSGVDRHRQLWSVRHRGQDPDELGELIELPGPVVSSQLGLSVPPHDLEEPGELLVCHRTTPGDAIGARVPEGVLTQGPLDVVQRALVSAYVENLCNRIAVVQHLSMYLELTGNAIAQSQERSISSVDRDSSHPDAYKPVQQAVHVDIATSHQGSPPSSRPGKAGYDVVPRPSRHTRVVRSTCDMRGPNEPSARGEKTHYAASLMSAADQQIPDDTRVVLEELITETGR